MTRFAAVGIVVIMLGVTGWGVWWWGQRSDVMPVMKVGQPQAVVTVLPGELRVVGDDREPERKAYFAKLD
jgi:hypothetical protein